MHESSSSWTRLPAKQLLPSSTTPVFCFQNNTTIILCIKASKSDLEDLQDRPRLSHIVAITQRSKSSFPGSYHSLAHKYHTNHSMHHSQQSLHSKPPGLHRGSRSWSILPTKKVPSLEHSAPHNQASYRYFDPLYGAGLMSEVGLVHGFPRSWPIGEVTVLSLDYSPHQLVSFLLTFAYYLATRPGHPRHLMWSIGPFSRGRYSQRKNPSLRSFASSIILTPIS